MDFFVSERRAKHNTFTLSLLFCAAMLFLIACVDAVLAIALASSSHASQYQPSFARDFANYFLPIAGIIILIVGIAVLYKSRQIQEGGPSIAAMLDGVPLDPNTQDPDERRLRDVVEEMALAASIPPPAIYVLYGEPNINAFAAGRTNADAVIGVTYGALKLLDRDELQGIVAHEFSHIVNGDTKLNIRMLSLVYGLLAIALIGQLALRASYTTRGSGRNSGGGYIVLIGLALMVIGFAGSFFGRLVRAAITRQRELLADAAAVQYTRNASGVAGALRKIGGATDNSYLLHCNAEEANQFLFSDGVASAWTATPFLATHPKLEDRIRRIDPSFDGTFINPGVITLPDSTAPHSDQYNSMQNMPGALLMTAAMMDSPATPAASAMQDSPLADDNPPPAQAPQASAQSDIPVSPAQPADDEPSVAPVLPTVRNEVSVRASFPPDIIAAAAEPVGAQALIYSLALSSDGVTRQAETGLLKTKLDDGSFAAVTTLAPTVLRLHGAARIPLVYLSIAGLTQLTKDQYCAFRSLLTDETHLQPHRDLFNYVLGKILARYLDTYFQIYTPPEQTVQTIAEVAPSAAILISTVCYIAYGKGVLAQSGFENGFHALGANGPTGGIAKPEDCTFDKIDEALAAVNTAVSSIRKNVLAACTRAVDCDQVAGPDEYAMLLAIADGLALDLPDYVADPFNPARGAVRE